MVAHVLFLVLFLFKLTEHKLMDFRNGGGKGAGLFHLSSKAAAHITAVTNPYLFVSTYEHGTIIELALLGASVVKSTTHDR